MGNVGNSLSALRARRWSPSPDHAGNHDVDHPLHDHTKIITASAAPGLVPTSVIAATVFASVNLLVVHIWVRRGVAFVISIFSVIIGACICGAMVYAGSPYDKPFPVRPNNLELIPRLGIIERHENHNPISGVVACGGWLCATYATTQSQSEWKADLGDFDTSEA